MSEIRHQPADDLVTRAVAATRQLPMPAGPSEAIQSHTLVALRAAAERPRATLFERINRMPWKFKAALVALAASLALVVAVLGVDSGASRAFADVVQAINNIRTATWKVATVLVKSADETMSWTGTGMFLAPFHERMENESRGRTTVQIVDGQQNKALILDPTEKTAVLINVTNLPTDRESPYGRTFEGLRETVRRAQEGKAANVEVLEGDAIDGRPARGYRLQAGSVEVKIWADPATNLPVRVEQTYAVGGTETRVVMSDFQVGMELDPSLFSLDVPEGYTVQQTAEIDMARGPITYLADVMKMVAEHNQGFFPDELRGERGIEGVMQRNFADPAIVEKYRNDPAGFRKLVTETSMKLGFVFGFLGAMSERHDWHYAGKGVKLGAPDAPIFWYRDHAESTTYHVLYADLSVKDVPAEEAPKPPAPQPEAEP
jgi:outer membrane lipoprotein-sorting protein